MEIVVFVDKCEFEITRRLIAGSEAIDRMDKEVKSVVSTVLGLVTKKHEVECWQGEFAKKFMQERFFSPKFPGCEWCLLSSPHVPNSDKSVFEISCHLNVGFGELKVLTRSYGNFYISHWHIQRVHESLPLLVDGMKKTFPFLEDSWRPIRDAADYAEKNGW